MLGEAQMRGLARRLLCPLPAMRNFIRVVIVRRGDTVAFERLCERFSDDPATVVMYDRRRCPREEVQMARENRRWPQDTCILRERGFLVVSRVQTAPPAPPIL